MQLVGNGVARSLAEIGVTPKDPHDVSLTLMLSESVPGNTFSWTFDVDAMMKRGRVRVGTFTTVPSAYGAPGSRVVAIATVPGAIGWAVTPRAAIGAIADLDLATGMAAGVPGLVTLATSGHPLPTSPSRIDAPTVAGLQQQRIVLAGKTRWFFLRGFRSGGAGAAFLQVFDRVNAPVAGTVPLVSELVLPNSNVFLPATLSGAPLGVTNGLVWAISTQPDVYTAYPTSEFWLRTAYD